MMEDLRKMNQLHSYRPAAMIAVMFAFLLLSSIAIFYSTAQNTLTAQALAVQALESTAAALSYSAEKSLRESGSVEDHEMKEIFSDRVIAYGLIAKKDGTILFHTNPRLVGSNLGEKGLEQWLKSGVPSGRRITLRTGIPAYEYNYILHRPDGTAEMIRLVLNTTPVDHIVLQARQMWWTVGIVLVFLWAVGISFSMIFIRYVRIQEELERRKRWALIGQMTAVLTHEIRNALGSIKGYTQWVHEKIAESDSKREGLAKVLQGTDRIESLVNDLLQFSREETYNIESLDVSSLVKETLVSAVHSWKGKVEMDIEPWIEAKADREKLYRVMANGIQNALQAMEANGNLYISVHSEGSWVKIQIKDNGPGIPDSELPNLFIPFYTTKTNGTGLGLSYSKKVIEGLGGKISLSNRKDKTGAVLTISLLKT
jgi:two-component system sensor histidine kinase HydH